MNVQSLRNVYQQMEQQLHSQRGHAILPLPSFMLLVSYSHTNTTANR